MTGPLEASALVECVGCKDMVVLGEECQRCAVLDRVLERQRREMGRHGHTYGIVPRTNVGVVAYKRSWAHFAPVVLLLVAGVITGGLLGAGLLKLFLRLAHS